MAVIRDVNGVTHALEKMRGSADGPIGAWWWVRRCDLRGVSHGGKIEMVDREITCLWCVVARPT